jgi:N6-adenosine-specific RNA methylase IME4
MTNTTETTPPGNIAGPQAQVEPAKFELARYDRACRALAEARSVDEVKDVRDVAMAMKLYAKQAKNRDLEADAYELRVRAERKLGEMIAAQKETVGLATGGQPYQRKSTGTAAEPVAPPPTPTLAEAGIDKKLSSRAQKISAIPSVKFEEMVAEGREEVQRAAEKRVVKEIKIAQARDSYDARAESGGGVEDMVALAASGKKFAVIYADPPWHELTWSERGGLRAPQSRYDTMTAAEVATLPVQPLAAKDSVLLLWTPWSQLPGALDVIKAWGFEYKTVAFNWVKQNRGGEGLHTGMGRWTRSNSEPCLLATNGDPLRLDMGVHQLIVSPVREHSRKPDEAHERIERLLVGPYVELFARAVRPGWVTWGNEIAPPQIANITPLRPADASLSDPPSAAT